MKVFHSCLSEANAGEGKVFRYYFFEATEPAEVGEIVIFDVFMALQVAESCNPLETARKVFTRQLSKEERFLGVESGEPDPTLIMSVNNY